MKRLLVTLGLCAVLAAIAAAPAFAAYWFYQGNLLGPVTKYRDDTSNQYLRMSFDNTNHPGHTQHLVEIDTGGTTHTINISCPSGSGCDTGSLAINALTYPTDGCGNPQSYAVYTNCKFGTGQ